MTPRLHVRRLGALTRQYEGGGINAASFSCRKERQGCPVRVNAYAGAVESSILIDADIAPHTSGTAEVHRNIGRVDVSAMRVEQWPVVRLSTNSVPTPRRGPPQSLSAISSTRYPHRHWRRPVH